MWVPTSAVSTGVLCPNQRRVPQLGSLFAEGVVALTYAIRLPVVIIVSAPVVLDLIAGPCYLDSKSHGLLMNCGAEIFSTEEIFEAAYACNGHFWRIISILADKLDPGLPQTFLNGMAMTGENSGLSTYMPGVIGSITKVVNNDPMGGLEQMKSSFVPSGRAGAFGMAYQALANPIAGAHWVCRMASRIITQAMQASRAQRSIASVFWNVLSEGIFDYDTIVVRRMLNTCGGLSIMASGYASPWGRVVYHYCVATVRMMVGTLKLLSLFTVDIPVLACVCKKSAGQPAGWILQNCEAPDRYKATMRRLIDFDSQCTTLVESITTDIRGVYDDTFAELYAGTRYVGSSLDYLVRVFDSTAGDCDNYASNPYVMTIIPNPVDYFRVCAKTEVCRVRCLQQVQAFEAVRPSAASVRSSTSSQVVQSLFFPAINDDTFMPFPDTGVVAMIELDDCRMCIAEGEDRCFIAGGFASDAFHAFQYCVPSALGMGVAKAGSWSTVGISGQSVDIQFVRSSAGGWMDIYSAIGMQDQLVQVCTRLTCVEFAPADVDAGVLGFKQMQAMDDKVVVEVRHVEGDRSYVVTSGLTDAGITFSWTATSTTNVWDQGLYHVVFDSPLHLFLVPFDDVPLQSCSWDAELLQTYGCSQYAGFDRKYVPVKTRGKQPRLSQYVTRGYGILLVTDGSSHWLQMLSIDTSGSSAVGRLGNSMPTTVRYTLQKSCSLDSCVGCVSLSVQRLCYAANQCHIARCIGTMVNVIRPLCASGAVVESGYNTLIAGLQGAWIIIVDTLVSVIEASSGVRKPIKITWPDQVFYGLMCTMKDTLASQVSILTSTVNGMVQVSVPLAQMQMGQAVDNKFLATFGMTMAAVTNFIFSLLLFPFYAAAAVQKATVCSTSSLIGLVAGNNNVVIGDPDIQRGTDSTLGKCLTQTFSENSQGTNSGTDNHAGFVAASSSLLDDLAGASQTIPFDAMIHGMGERRCFVYLVTRWLTLSAPRRRGLRLHSGGHLGAAGRAGDGRPAQVSVHSPKSRVSIFRAPNTLTARTHTGSGSHAVGGHSTGYSPSSMAWCSTSLPDSHRTSWCSAMGSTHT